MKYLNTTMLVLSLTFAQCGGGGPEQTETEKDKKLNDTTNDTNLTTTDKDNDKNGNKKDLNKSNINDKTNTNKTNTEPVVNNANNNNTTNTPVVNNANNNNTTNTPVVNNTNNNNTTNTPVVNNTNNDTTTNSNTNPPPIQSTPPKNKSLGAKGSTGSQLATRNNSKAVLKAAKEQQKEIKKLVKKMKTGKGLDIIALLDKATDYKNMVKDMTRKIKVTDTTKSTSNKVVYIEKAFITDKGAIEAFKKDKKEFMTELKKGKEKAFIAYLTEIKKEIDNDSTKKLTAKRAQELKVQITDLEKRDRRFTRKLKGHKDLVVEPRNKLNNIIKTRKPTKPTTPKKPTTTTTTTKAPLPKPIKS